MTDRTFTDSIYGNHLDAMRDVQRDVLSRIDGLRRTYAEGTDMDPVEHCLSRIKSEESMREKCRRLGLPENEQSALREIKDAIGVRVVCAFLNDIYAVRDFLSSQPDLTVVEEKDYIGSAKPNGYRSYHMILRTDSGYYIEVQIRTISMDTWAALEHHIHYKKEKTANDRLIAAELKRCADELASTDVSMQEIRNLIFESRRNDT